MADCDDCSAAAKDWTWGGFKAACAGCTVRAIAGSPKHIRDAEYRLCKPDELPEFQKAVKAEYQRIQTLKRETEDR